MKLAIIGSRTFNDYKLLDDTLQPYITQIKMVVSGGANGADKLGEQWANKNNIPIKIFYADWNKFGKIAGFKRNSLIIDECDGVVAFWDNKSKGTLDSINKAKQQNKPVKIVSF